MSIREKDGPELFARIQERNLLRQYDLLTNCIEIGLKNGIESFDKYTLWALNHAAVSNIAQFGGRYREEPIYVGNHRPPHFKEIPNMMDRFFSVIHENWEIIGNPTVLPAYALWRLNWIHPFFEGNGRTARAACYYLLCLSRDSYFQGAKSFQKESAKIVYRITRRFALLMLRGIREISMSRNWRHISTAY